MTTNKIESTISYKKELNRLILENNWWGLKHFIEYKCDWYGKHLVLVNPKNTSRKCSKCSYVDKNNRKNKKFYCLKCGLKMDADLNASINILEAGLALIACGDYHVSDSVKQELEIKTSN